MRLRMEPGQWNRHSSSGRGVEQTCHCGHEEIWLSYSTDCCQRDSGPPLLGQLAAQLAGLNHLIYRLQDTRGWALAQS